MSEFFQAPSILAATRMGRSRNLVAGRTAALGLGVKQEKEAIRLPNATEQMARATYHESHARDLRGQQELESTRAAEQAAIAHSL